MQALNGLPMEYEAFITTVTNAVRSFDDLKTKLLHQEQRLLQLLIQIQPSLLRHHSMILAGVEVRVSLLLLEYGNRGQGRNNDWQQRHSHGYNNASRPNTTQQRSGFGP